MKLKVFLLIVATVLSSLLLRDNVFAGSVFLRNLRLGDSGPDVKFLQQLLNKDPETRVSAGGVGSLGLETSYFGLLTKEAVKKFQRKYAKDVLVPAGITEPTGFVGILTRAKLEGLYVSSLSPSVTTPKEPNSATVPPTSSTQTPGTTAIAPVISGISPSIAFAGDVIYVIGTGFSQLGNKVEIAGSLLPATRSPGGTFVYFTLPNLPAGSYSVRASNANGPSNALQISVSAPWSPSLATTSPIASVSLSATTSQLFTFSISPNMTEETFAPLVSSFAQSQGQVLGATTAMLHPFGGIIVTVPCANGILLKVGPPSPGFYMFTPGPSQAFLYYKLITGAWALGLSNGILTECVISGAANIPALGTILIVGVGQI